ncbi:hypothetical protein F5Y12DRAFT_791798 [Xylaria sp. FL1777]|nr:hypothetical protein F5Y12DRAFT_791798 [Xylaria sp. FL1777]
MSPSERMLTISSMCNLRIPTKLVTDTRRSVPDKERKYAKITEKGTVVATTNSILPNLDLTTVVIGLGSPRRDNKLQKGLCYLNQWTIMNVLIVLSWVMHAALVGASQVGTQARCVQFSSIN